MSKSKTTIPTPFDRKPKAKAPEPKAKYFIDQKVFTIVYHKGRPEELLEAKVGIVVSEKTAIRDISGKKIGLGTSFTYAVSTPHGPLELSEYSLYPSFFEAAKVFAKAFLYLLK